jgi:hypothetical protein
MHVTNSEGSHSNKASLLFLNGEVNKAEIGRLKKENDVKLVCLKRENKLKGPF